MLSGTGKLVKNNSGGHHLDTFSQFFFFQSWQIYATDDKGTKIFVMNGFCFPFRLQMFKDTFFIA